MDEYCTLFACRLKVGTSSDVERALRCSTPRVDNFGGGARRLDPGARKRLAWIDCEHWLATVPDHSANRGRAS